MLDLPSNEDALAALAGKYIDYGVFAVNSLCVTLWLDGDGDVIWNIGYFTKQVSATVYEVEQLVRKVPGDDVHWINPVKPIIEVVDEEQVLRRESGARLEVIGQWDFSRVNVFCLKNLNAVKDLFIQVKDTFSAA